MYRLLFLILLVAFIGAPRSGFAQMIDFNKIVYPPEMRAKTYEEYLVQLAWQNMPENKRMERQVNISKLERENLKWDWTDNIGATVNLNEYTLRRVFGRNAVVDTGNLVITSIDPSLNFPIFNVGATVKLGTFVQRQRKDQIAELKVEMAEDVVNQRKLFVRSEVLSRYQAYLLTIEIHKTRVKAEEDALANYTLVSQLFKADDEDTRFEDFNNASITYHNATEQTARAKTNIQTAKIALEEVIGVKLEDVQFKQ